jgi:hypothetical protein
MAWSRANLLLLLVPFPAVVVLPASLENVNASQCLTSAEAVRQEYPGAWPSWTMQAAHHKGVKCWFPATRDARSRPVESASKKIAVARRRIESDAENVADDGPLDSAEEMNALGWSFRSRTERIGAAASRDDSSPDSSFDDRFAAAFERNSLRQPSTIQYMMVWSGNLPSNSP